MDDPSLQLGSFADNKMRPQKVQIANRRSLQATLHSPHSRRNGSLCVFELGFQSKSKAVGGLQSYAREAF